MNGAQTLEKPGTPTPRTPGAQLSGGAASRWHSPEHWPGDAPTPLPGDVAPRPSQLETPLHVLRRLLPASLAGGAGEATPRTVQEGTPQPTQQDTPQPQSRVRRLRLIGDDSLFEEASQWEAAGVLDGLSPFHSPAAAAAVRAAAAAQRAAEEQGHSPFHQAAARERTAAAERARPTLPSASPTPAVEGGWAALDHVPVVGVRCASVPPL